VTSASLYGTDRTPADQRAALTGGDVPVAVYGLGKMGLPLAAVYAETTGNVTGVDIDPDVVTQVQRGETPVENEPGLSELVARTVETGAFRATTDAGAAAADAAVHVLIVPTLITDDHDPDLSSLYTVLERVGSGLARGDVVVVESTVPPGTCRGTVTPALAGASGLAEEEFGVAFCPERTASGRALQDIRSAYPKVVGGKDPESTRVAELVYGEITSNDVIAVSDCTTAECVKVFEGVYRDVNIALANELARLAPELGVDVREAIRVANTQPFCEIHDPGPGVGGHCIPYYPYFLINGCETDVPLLRQTRAVNDSMATVTVERLSEELDSRGTALDGAEVVLLGVTYRPGVDETRASPALAVAERLRDAGAAVSAVDPVCSEMGVVDATPVSLDRLADLSPDAVVLVTGHEAFGDVDWDRLDPALVLDTRDALDDVGPSDLVTLGDGSR
jgi:UDP-N-acetyl-D-mannosaminuronic acid dehydrogenase